VYPQRYYASLIYFGLWFLFSLFLLLARLKNVSLQAVTDAQGVDAHGVGADRVNPTHTA